MKDRIRQLMESQRLTQQEFAEKLNISPASLSSIFNARTKPTLNHVEAIMKSFPNVSILWLLNGEGDMFVGDGSSAEDGHASIPAPSGVPSQPGDLFADFPIDSPPLHQTATHTTSPQPPTRREIQTVKIVDKPQRQITEIRIFYDDQTWETFVPKK